MLALVTEARIYRPDLAARFVLNRCGARTVLARETAETLANYDPPVLAATVRRGFSRLRRSRAGWCPSWTTTRPPREIAALADEIDRLRIGRSAR